METSTTRRSDRVSLELPLQISGTDSLGEGYIEEAHSIVLSRHGAKIVLNRKLTPEQELTLRCNSTGRVVDARVVGQLGRDTQGYFYGVEFLDASKDLWNIDFPSPSDLQKAAARVLLECVSCNSWAVSYLTEVEAEVFEANRCISRHCKTCREMGLWTEPIVPASAQPASRKAPNAAESQPGFAEHVRTQNERAESRVGLRMTACIRAPQLGEEVVFTEDVSRGGFRFKSPKRYAKGPLLEIAVPYTRKAGSIFVLAQIEWDRPLPSEGVTLYGAAYVQVQGSNIQRNVGQS